VPKNGRRFFTGKIFPPGIALLQYNRQFLPSYQHVVNKLSTSYQHRQFLPGDAVCFDNGRSTMRTELELFLKQGVTLQGRAMRPSPLPFCRLRHRVARGRRRSKNSPAQSFYMDSVMRPLAGRVCWLRIPEASAGIFQYYTMIALRMQDKSC